MGGQICVFTASGSARGLSRAIEQYADERRVLSALLVPWETDGATLSMAVTSVKVDGWAIEHTNLATIKLLDLGGDRTEVTIIAHEHQSTEKERLTAQLDRFARQLVDRFGDEPRAR
jgi:hypothetical protein